MEKAKLTGKILGMSYDFRLPTVEVIKERMWNRKDKRTITPRVFGIGWTIDFYQLLKRMKLIK